MPRKWSHHVNQQQPADPRLRRRALWALLAAGIGALAAATLLQGWQPRLESWVVANQQTLASNPWAVALALLLLFLPLMAAALYCTLYGRRVVAEQRFPPAGALVIRATTIEEGPRAVLRGRLMQALGWCLLLLSVGFPLWLAAVLHQVLSP